MTTVSNKQKWFNTIRLTNDDDLYVGIDTHKQSFHVALWLNDSPAIDFVMPPDAAKLIDTLSKIRVALRLIVYEAGPTGYSLARAMKDANLPDSQSAYHTSRRRPYHCHAVRSGNL